MSLHAQADAPGILRRSNTRCRGVGELLHFLLRQQLNLVCRRHRLLAQVKPRYLVSTFTDVNRSDGCHIQNTCRDDAERSECPLRQYYTPKYTGVDGLTRGHDERGERFVKVCVDLTMQPRI